MVLPTAILLSMVLPPDPQIQATKALPLAASVSSAIGPGTLARGASDNTITLRFNGDQKTAKVRLMSTTSGPGGRTTRVRPTVVFEDTIQLYSSNMLGARRGSFYLPLTFRNGRYQLEAELENLGKSPAIAVQVVDPPTKILSWTSPKKIADAIGFQVNFAPESARIVVTRTKNAAFPEEWWAPYNSVGASTSILVPTRTVNSDGTMELKANLRATLGAGNFRARVQGGSTHTNSEYKTFGFDFPSAGPALYTLRYEAIECLVETDEVGDDEVYTLHIVGTTRKKTSPGYAHPSVKLHGPQGMSEGRKRSANFDVFSFSKLDQGTSLLWAVALLENDDGNPEAYRHQVDQSPWSNIMTEPFNRASVGGMIVTPIMEYRKKQSGNSDELLTWAFVPLDPYTDLSNARKNKGWHTRNVTIEGDGGKYRLTFSISAGPKPK